MIASDSHGVDGFVFDSACSLVSLHVFESMWSHLISLGLILNGLEWNCFELLAVAF